MIGSNLNTTWYNTGLVDDHPKFHGRFFYEVPNLLVQLFLLLNDSSSHRDKLCREVRVGRELRGTAAKNGETANCGSRSQGQSRSGSDSASASTFICSS